MQKATWQANARDSKNKGLDPSSLSLHFFYFISCGVSTCRSHYLLHNLSWEPLTDVTTYPYFERVAFMKMYIVKYVLHVFCGYFQKP